MVPHIYKFCNVLLFQVQFGTPLLYLTNVTGSENLCFANKLKVHLLVNLYFFYLIFLMMTSEGLPLVILVILNVFRSYVPCHEAACPFTSDMPE